MSILIERCAVLDPDQEWGYSADRYIVIEGNRIQSVTGQRPGGAFERVISGEDRLAVPGLINAHTHSPENYLRASTECLPLEPWLIFLFGMSGEYSPRDYYLSAMLGIIEMFRTGVTSVVDHLWMNPPFQREAMDAVMEACRDSGIRAAVAPLYRDVAYDLEYGRSLGHTLEDPFFAETDATQLPVKDMMDVLASFIEQWHLTEGGRLKAFVGPGGLQWCSEELLRASLDLARQHRSGLHMHLFETRLQWKACQFKHGRSGVEWMAERELLGPEVSLPHSVWVRSEKELQCLAESQSMVVHNPAANLKLGSGLAPIKAMLEKGITVALGADGACSSDNQVMFEALRLAALIHDLSYPEPERWITAREAVKMVTEAGGAVMGLEGELGRIQEGWLADITLLDLSASNLVPLNDACKQLAFCESGSSVRTVLVDGRVVFEEGKIQTIDEQAIIAEAKEAVKGRPHRKAMPPEVARFQKEIAAFQQDVAKHE